MEPPLVEDWHARCQAICTGVEGAERENLCFKFGEKNEEVDVRNRSGSSRAKRLWTPKEEVTRIMSNLTRQNERREAVRQQLCAAHLESPTFALLSRTFFGKWKRGKARTLGLEGATADFILSLCLRGEREVGTRRCANFFLCAERCPPRGGASRFALLVCSYLRAAFPQEEEWRVANVACE